MYGECGTSISSEMAIFSTCSVLRLIRVVVLVWLNQCVCFDVIGPKLDNNHKEENQSTYTLSGNKKNQKQMMKERNQIHIIWEIYQQNSKQQNAAQMLIKYEYEYDIEISMRYV